MTEISSYPEKVQFDALLIRKPTQTKVWFRFTVFQLVNILHACYISAMGQTAHTECAVGMSLQYVYVYSSPAWNMTTRLRCPGRIAGPESRIRWTAIIVCVWMEALVNLAGHDNMSPSVHTYM